MKGFSVADDRNRLDRDKPDLFAKKLPPKQRRIKQTVAHQIEEAFEDEAAVEEALHHREGDLGPEWPEENDDYEEWLSRQNAVADNDPE